VVAALGPDLEGVLEELNVPGGQSAVDLRCEEGYFTASLPSCLARPCTVYAMDLDAELTEHARRHVAERGKASSLRSPQRTLYVWHAMFPNRWVSCC
jgi:protein-L-isoaspartate O-methyltransferase